MFLRFREIQYFGHLSCSLDKEKQFPAIVTTFNKINTIDVQAIEGIVTLIKK